MSQQHSTPPVISGFNYVRHLGSGGYADVFLYEQENPRSEVAVKVLRGADTKGAEAFETEAHIMASVSHHPFIVRVSQAGISADGRPFFVMAYYSGENFSDRSRNETLGVPEVLRVGVQLASAVETAHRAGILHRDIKPANVLTDRYNMPGLTDFGIASPAGQADIAEGMSVPWAPPEAFGNAVPDERYDVYSLAATVYSMLAGRSPFEIPGGDNSQLALMERVEHTPVPPIGRQDVPPSLENVLRVAMTKDRERRTATAADFGRQLNQIENELKLGQTQLLLEGVPRGVRERDVEADEEATRIKGVQEIDAQAPAPSKPGLIDGVIGVPSGVPVAPRARQGMPGRNVVDGATVSRSGAPGSVPEAGDGSGMDQVGVERQTSSRTPLILAALGLLVVVVLAVVVSSGDGGGGSDNGDTSGFDEPNDGLDIHVSLPPPSVDEVLVTDNGDGTYSVSWAEPADGLRYIVTPEGGQSSEPMKATSVDIDARCAVVETMDSVGLIGTGVRGCAS